MVATAATAIVALLSACTGGGGATPGGSSDKLTIALSADVGLDWTAIGSGGSSVLLLQTAWDSLLRQEPDGTLVPNAAESWEVNEDNTTFTFHLRDDMEFPDGTPVDAAASKASMEYLRDAGQNESVYLAGAEISTPDDLTVVVDLPAPSKVLLDYMALSAGIIANPESLGDPDAGPQGSGPYVLDDTRTTTGSTYTFVRNENYWNEELYPYDEVVYSVLTDPTAALSALTTGQVDATFVPTQSVAQVQNGKFNLAQVQVNWAGLHIFDRAGQLVPALADVKVRQAMNMVFDRAAIIDALFPGGGVESNQIFNPTSDNPGYNPDMADEYPYDVEAAKALMDEAGYADGFDMQLPKVPGFDAANPLIIQQLGELNIRVEEVDVTMDQFGDVLGGKYPVFYFTLGSTNSAVRVVDETIRPDSLWNPLHSQTPELDALIATADAASGDDQAPAYQAISDYLVDQAWYSPWAYITDTWATASDVEVVPCVTNQSPFLYAFTPSS